MLPSIKLKSTRTNYALVYTPVEEISKVIGNKVRISDWLLG
jgi:hypothetical protein